MTAIIKEKSYETRDKTNSKEGLVAKFINKEKEENNSPDNLLDIKYVKNEVAKDDKKFNENFELLKPLKAGVSGAIKIINKQKENDKEVSIHSKEKSYKTRERRVQGSQPSLFFCCIYG